jgi:hypothetical protein
MMGPRVATTVSWPTICCNTPLLDSPCNQTALLVLALAHSKDSLTRRRMAWPGGLDGNIVRISLNMPCCYYNISILTTHATRVYSSSQKILMRLVAIHLHVYKPIHNHVADLLQRGHQPATAKVDNKTMRCELKSALKHYEYIRCAPFTIFMRYQ